MRQRDKLRLARLHTQHEYSRVLVHPVNLARCMYRECRWQLLIAQAHEDAVLASRWLNECKAAKADLRAAVARTKAALVHRKQQRLSQAA